MTFRFISLCTIAFNRLETLSYDISFKYLPPLMKPWSLPAADLLGAIYLTTP